MILFICVAIWYMSYWFDAFVTSGSYAYDRNFFFKNEIDGNVKELAKKKGVAGIMSMMFTAEYLMSVLMLVTAAVISGVNFFGLTYYNSISLGFLIYGFGHILGGLSNVISITVRVVKHAS